jgi:hypothetical protein
MLTMHRHRLELGAVATMTLLFGLSLCREAPA